MGDETTTRNEAAFYHAIDKAEKVYRRYGNINGFVIRRSLLTGKVSLGLGEDQGGSLYETKALSERGLDGRIRCL